MTTLIWQTALILLSAYFMGAWTACLIRRTFFAGVSADADNPRVTAPASQMAAAAGQAGGAPMRRPDPKPIAMETIQRSAPQASADAASKFESVLTTAPQPAARPAPIPAKIDPIIVQPPLVTSTPAAASAPAVTVGPAAASAVETATVAPAQVAPPAERSTTPVTAAPQAAITVIPAAVATLAAAAPKPMVQVLPTAASGGGPSAVSAPLAATPAADEFVRIRAIDPALQARLVALGITSYRQIAGWLPGDVARISTALGFNGRIEQENWIEQAQILARGGETAFSRRIDRGETTIEAPSTPLPTTAKAPEAAPIPAASTATPQVETRAAFAEQGRPSAPAVASVPVAAATAPARAETVTQGSSVIPDLGAALAATVETNAPNSSVSPVPAGTVMPAAGASLAPAQRADADATGVATGMAAATASAVAAGTGMAAGLGRDNLQRIRGINAEVEKLLNVQGFSRYSQIASWTPADATRIDRMLGYEGRVATENWIEQAGILSRGGSTAFSRKFDDAAATAKKPVASTAAPPATVTTAPPAATTDAPRLSRLPDPVRDTVAKGAVDADAPPRASDMSTLRSVRSEAYSPQVGAPRTGAPDDLKRIRGIGVLIEKKLVSMGISTYGQIANWSTSDLDRVSNVLDFKGRIERENWVEQARILAAGGQTEFSRRVDRGEVGH